MRKLIKDLDGMIATLQKRGQYGTIPSRQYVPAGQKPIAMRCPGGEHAHGGFGYCHPERRKHRIAGQPLHEESARLKVIEHHMNRLGDVMTDMARRKKVVPERIKADYARLYRYLQRVQGTKRQRPINRV
ncbi:hypothetical protein LCGC14_2520550 [marine sediment metagenome]|uniref:Uncharacterized protein n=1 Tax=marine sediment metagenome TaxID=412755 RepID=A0A0F9AWZ4_9ZZZZ